VPRLGFRLLGPLQVQIGDEDLAIGGPKERAVLALLLLNANRVVSRDSIVEGLWGESPPKSARHTIAGYVSRLRKRLDLPDSQTTIETRAGGYVLRCLPDSVDLYRFEELLEQGRAALDAAAADRALEVFDEALELWRGEPLSDVADEPFAAPEIRWLEELRVGAIEARVEAALALGQEAEVVGELRSLVARHPYRERFRVQLMTALYRTGRQTEALECYRAGRQLLVDELGVEPGAELRDLERAILAHDETIDARHGHTLPAGHAPGQGAEQTFLRSRPRRLVAAVVIVLAAAGAAVGLAFRGTSASVSGEPGIVSLDPRTGTVVRLLSTPSAPGTVVSAHGALWVTQPGNGTIVRFDRRRRAPVETIKVGDQTGGTTSDRGALWVVSHGAGSLARIDPATGKIDRIVRVGNDPTAVVSGYGSIWVVNAHDRTVSRVDPNTGRVLAVIATDSTGPGLAVGAGGVWVSDEPTGRVVEIDPGTNAVRRQIRVGNAPIAIAVDGPWVWVANRIDDDLMRIDARSGLVDSTRRAGEAPSAVLAAEGTVWVANELSNSVSQFRPGAAGPRTITVEGRPIGLSVVGREIIVSLVGS
jgi:DNA-binding SARP family transcriptional activator/streptogramin lyase